MGSVRMSHCANRLDLSNVTDPRHLLFHLMNDRLSTYTLSPHSALIDMHVVESIHPAPHITFYDGFRAALARMAGIDVDRQANGGMRGCVSDGNVARNPFRA